jgi:hypothetical protein
MAMEEVQNTAFRSRIQVSRFRVESISQNRPNPAAEENPLFAEVRTLAERPKIL